MAISDVLERIDADGASEIARIEEESLKTIHAIEKEATDTLTSLHTEAETTRARRSEKVRERVLAEVRRTIRFLEEKHVVDAVQMVKDAMQKNIAVMDTQTYTALLQKELECMGEDKHTALFTVAPERSEETLAILLEHGVPKEHATLSEKTGTLGGYEAKTAKHIRTMFLSDHLEHLFTKKKPEILAHIMRLQPSR